MVAGASTRAIPATASRSTSRLTFPEDGTRSAFCQDITALGEELGQSPAVASGRTEAETAANGHVPPGGVRTGRPALSPAGAADAGALAGGSHSARLLRDRLPLDGALR